LAIAAAAAAAAGRLHGQLHPASPPRLTAGCRAMPAMKHVRSRQLTAATPTPSTRGLHHQQQGEGNTAGSASLLASTVCTCLPSAVCAPRAAGCANSSLAANQPDSLVAWCSCRCEGHGCSCFSCLQSAMQPQHRQQQQQQRGMCGVHVVTGGYHKHCLPPTHAGPFK
jgi:hypothetical protein